MRNLWRVTVLLLLILSGVALAQGEPRPITVTPPAGPIGTTHELVIDGLTPNASYRLSVVFTETGAEVYTTTLTADSAGVASIRLFTEPSDPLGVYDVLLIDDNTVIARGTITITEGDRIVTDLTGVLVSGQPVTTALTATIRADVYGFEVQAGDRVTISMQSTEFDAYLELLDADGTILTFNNDGGRGTDALIRTYELPASGFYFVNATSVDGVQTGTYTITLMIARRADEGVIEPGEVVIGALTTGRQTAEYTFSAQAGDRATVDLASDDFDPLVRLFDPNGVEIAANDDGGPGLYALINNLTLNQSGEYRIRVDSFRGYVGRRVVAGEYALMLTVVRDGRALTPSGVAQVPPPQPTDAPAVEATPVIVGNVIRYGETLSGALTDDQQTVEYQFFGIAGEIVRISAQSTEFDGILRLLDPNGFEVAFDDDSGGNLNPLIRAYPLPSTGVYTVVVDGYRGANADRILRGAFTVTLDRVDETGAIISQLPTSTPLPPTPTPTPTVPPAASPSPTLTPLPTLTPSPAPTLELPADVPMLSYGETVRGELTLENPTRRHLFEGRAGDVISILMISDDFDPLVRLLTLEGTQIAFDDDSAGNLNALISGFVLPADGAYIIVADSFFNAQAPVSGAYTLSLFSGVIDAPDVALPPAATPTPLPVVVPGGRAQPLGEIAYDEPVSLSFAGTPDEAYSYTFTAEQGDIVTVRVTSGGGIDTAILLTSADGALNLLDDDSGDGFDPELYRVPLSAGVHTLEILPYIPGARGEVTIVIIRESPLALDGVAQIVQISDKNPTQALTFRGEGGSIARITVVSRSQVVGAPVVTVTQDGELIAQNSIGISTRLIFEFVVPADGELMVTVELPGAPGEGFGFGVLEITGEIVEE